MSPSIKNFPHFLYLISFALFSRFLSRLLKCWNKREEIEWKKVVHIEITRLFLEWHLHPSFPLNLTLCVMPPYCLVPPLPFCFSLCLHWTTRLAWARCSQGIPEAKRALLTRHVSSCQPRLLVRKLFKFNHVAFGTKFNYTPINVATWLFKIFITLLLYLAPLCHFFLYLLFPSCFSIIYFSVLLFPLFLNLSVKIKDQSWNIKEDLHKQ